LEESLIFDHTVGSYCDPSYRQGFISYTLEQLSCGRDQDASEVGRIIQFCAAMSTFRNSAVVVVNVYRTSVLAAVTVFTVIAHIQCQAVRNQTFVRQGMAVDVDSLVSMNMWGLTPDFLTTLEEGFKEFFEKEVPGNPLKAEYLIPIFIGELLEHGKMSVKVLKTNDTWYGMTYHEDVAAVKDSFKRMLENGVYKTDLFSDL
jgi:hypothetical protein